MGRATRRLTRITLSLLGALVLLAAAGVGIAFHAKPVVRYQAHVALTYSGLDGVINLFAD